jgi:pyruvate dehydrogenase (quinone)/pyruvate oxidase
MDDRAGRLGESGLMKPQMVVHQLDPLLRDDAIVITDSGTNTCWTARYIKIRGNQQFSCSGTLATMACSPGYALGAQTAFPGRQVIVVVGDGGLSMLMGDLATFAKYKLPVKFVVIKNNVLGQIKWEQMVFLGNPEFGVELQPIDFVKVAEGCGVAGFHVEAPDALPATLRAFLDAPGPALLEAMVDPYEPPMPPMVTFDQAEKMAKSLARGEHNRGKIAVTLFRDEVEDFATTAPGPLQQVAEKVADLVGAGDGSRRGGGDGGDGRGPDGTTGGARSRTAPVPRETV